MYLSKHIVKSQSHANACFVLLLGKKINTLYDCPGFPKTDGSNPKPKPKPTEVVPTIVPDLGCKDTNE